MKRITLVLFTLVVLATLFNCGSKKDDQDTTAAATEEDATEWKEMDDFHMVMAETFHPYKDSSDLAPIKAKAGELYTAAETWASKPLPSKVDNEETKSKLEQLKTETQSLQTLVTSGSDEAIGQQLTKVHDLFHGIQESWYGGGKHEH